MPSALLRLLLIQARAAVRRALLGLRTVKGALLALVGLGMFLLWIVPTGFAVAAAPPVDPRHVRDFTPLALLLLTLASVVSAGEKAIAFTPSEVNFLFPAPFTRRQLLAYKLAKSAAGSLAMALILSLATRRFSPFWPAAFVGGLAALLFVNLSTVAVALLRKSGDLRTQTPLRLTVAYALLIAIAAGTAAAVAKGAAFLDSASAFIHSPVARVILAPVQPFARAFVADSFPSAAAWGAAALAIDAALLVLVMRLDANYLEAAAAAADRAYEQAQRVRRGDWMPAVGLSGNKSRVPPFPFLGGVGPVAHRQLTTLLRKYPKLVFVVLLAVATFVPILLLGRRLPNIRAVLAPAIAWLTVLLGGTLRFDFRGDLDQLPWLKSLPLRPLPVAAGQLVVPAAAMTLFHVVACAGIAAAIEPLRRPALAGMVLAGPFNLLMIAVENLAFLLFPHRQAPPSELGAIGRQMVLFFLKLIAVIITAGVAGGVGAVTFAVSRSPALGVAAAAIVLTIEALALIPLVAVAYRRFDPGSDLPP